MTIADFFENITKRECPDLTSGLSTANSVQDFYKDCIRNTMPKIDIIKRWHEILKKYINDSESVFFVRRYASSKDKDDRWDIRRGFLTVYNNIKYVFVDNYFAHYFYAMAYNEFVPEYDDFKQFVSNREIPYGYRDVSLERSHQAYKKGAEYPLNRKGWKLSHVFSANQNDYNFDYKRVVANLFPKGEYSDFKKHNGSIYPYRMIKQDVSEENIKIIKAHFLRVVHPINHFLTPMVKFQNSTMSIKDIGEYREMIEFMKDKLSELFGIAFTEYMDMILAPYRIASHKYWSPIKLQYGMGLSKSNRIVTYPKIEKKIFKRDSTTTSVAPQSNNSKHKREGNMFTPTDIANCIQAYLFDGYSYRDIENKLLGLEYKAKGGGWIAKKLLESNGINASMKKKFYGQTIDTAIGSAIEPLKSTLLWLKEELT